MFTYNILKLLEGVKNRPCLWDKSHDAYSDRVQRRAAWEEIFNILEPNYEQMNEELQRNVSTAVTNKWANVRDTFIKAIKAKGNKKRKYIYHDHLEFLFKVIKPTAENEEDNSDNEADTWGYINQEGAVENIPNYVQKHSARSEESHESTSSTEPVRKRKKRQNYHQEYQPPEAEVDTQLEEVSSDPLRVMNEDEAFFASLLPTVVRYDEDERLEFRMEVLTVMKKIKEKRRWAYVDHVKLE